MASLEGLTHYFSSKPRGKDKRYARYRPTARREAMQPQRQTVNFEGLAHSNMLTLNALVELLNERGIVAKGEVLDRVKKLQAETAVSEGFSDLDVVKQTGRTPGRDIHYRSPVRDGISDR